MSISLEETAKDAETATELLATKVPAELVSEILDYAEYFDHEIIGVGEKGFVQSTWWGYNGEMNREGGGWSGIKVYLVAQIPDFMALGKDTIGKGGLGGGRPGRVRKIVFRLRCRDQGWSSHPEVDGTYEWGRSRIDVEIWRERQKLPLKNEAANVVSRKDGDMYKVCESLLQRNKIAETDVLKYEVSWRWDEDKPLDDTKRVDEIGRHEKNGQFVRELKGGDEIRILIKAFYAGWECRVEHCEVECWWAV
ncbi:hypothetical protein TWF481_006713 [Arthrobotrys musiformis]|uniref:F-box domain-containing protein n=1 Tax=Arthrobotrys musiformis TaxID=47236 RepID=A0AAV9WAA1_9PEZI